MTQLSRRWSPLTCFGAFLGLGFGGLTALRRGGRALRLAN